ncbi:MAG: hypothetical protein M1480_01020 [Bacteroidetes bacterium]|nr:hypothetical protein [Bacteroidota bacterium]
MNLLEEEIKNITTEIVERNKFFLIDLLIHGNRGSRSIEVFIDGEKNVSADDCAIISQEINSQLENLPDIGLNYNLEVSSPGVDRPLKFLRQYPKHINRKFEITYKLDNETKKAIAKFIKIEGEELTFTSSGTEIKIKFNNIIKAKVLISFS